MLTLFFKNYNFLRYLSLFHALCNYFFTPGGLKHSRRVYAFTFQISSFYFLVLNKYNPYRRFNQEKMIQQMHLILYLMCCSQAA